MAIPEAGPVFLSALALHVTAGVTSVVSGTLAASARKEPGRHPKAGRVYLYGIAGVAITAWVMAAIRWRADWHLALIATITAGLAVFGWISRVRPDKTRHAWGMGGSFIALLTGFYVDNGPQLPLWDRLPHLAYWVLPSAVGIPLILRALRRATARAAVKQ
jgi:hypothetical protein